MKKKPFVLGISGKTASGKSEVLAIFDQLGWKTLDCDKVVYELYKSGKEGQRRISDFFGEEFILKKGDVNRNKLRKIVFSDPKKLKILNSLIHPLVFNEVHKFIDSCSVEDKIAIESFYIERKWIGEVVDKVIFIERPYSHSVDSLKSREIKMELIEKILNINPEPIKIDFVLKNNSTLKALRERVIMSLEKLSI